MPWPPVSRVEQDTAHLRCILEEYAETIYGYAERIVYAHPKDAEIVWRNVMCSGILWDGAARHRTAGMRDVNRAWAIWALVKVGQGGSADGPYQRGRR